MGVLSREFLRTLGSFLPICIPVPDGRSGDAGSLRQGSQVVPLLLRMVMTDFHDGEGMAGVAWASPHTEQTQ